MRKEVAMTDENWPPRFTMTPEAAIRLIMFNFTQEKNEAKTELALLTLINEVYEQGKRDASRELSSP